MPSSTVIALRMVWPRNKKRAGGASSLVRLQRVSLDTGNVFDKLACVIIKTEFCRPHAFFSWRSARRTGRKISMLKPEVRSRRATIHKNSSIR